MLLVKNKGRFCLLLWQKDKITQKELVNETGLAKKIQSQLC